jgi:hypothetical protein
MICFEAKKTTWLLIILGLCTKQQNAFKFPSSSRRLVGSRPYGKSRLVGWNVLHASSFSTDTEEEEKDDDVTARTEKKIVEYAKGVGVDLSLSTLGPGYRAVARASHDPEQILGYCEGFVRPGVYIFFDFGFLP